MKDSKDYKKYPAVDGVEHINDEYVKKPIRSDIEEILKLNDNDFAEWFHDREFAVKKLLTNYEFVASIPDLRYSYENQRLGLDANSEIRSIIGTLKKGLEYLEVIRNVREHIKN